MVEQRWGYVCYYCSRTSHTLPTRLGRLAAVEKTRKLTAQFAVLGTFYGMTQSLILFFDADFADTAEIK